MDKTVEYMEISLTRVGMVDDVPLIHQDMCDNNRCARWIDDKRCGPRLVERLGFRCCPVCHGSYGPVETTRIPPPTPAVANPKFGLGERVRKVNGSSWQGHVVGFYSTKLTPVGYAVESEREPGSVQIYPEQALSALRGEG